MALAKVNNTAINNARPYVGKFPYLNYIIQAGNGEFSNYDALQVTVNERASHGLRFLAGYSYAHATRRSLRTRPSRLPAGAKGTDFRTSYGNSNNDIRHRFTFSPSYKHPGMKSPAQMLKELEPQRHPDFARRAAVVALRYNVK